MARLRSSWVPRCFGDRLKTGFCLGCGGRTRYVKGQLKRTGKQGDSLNWHQGCYRLFYRMWTQDLFREDRLLRCVVCGRVFIASRKGGYRQKNCSEECRKVWKLKLAQVRRRIYVPRPLPRSRRACVVCGKEFAVGGGLGGGTKLTCSELCRKERKRRVTAAWHKAHPRPLKVDLLGYQRSCVVCGKSFTIKNPREWRRNACSLACRNERNRRIDAAWKRAHRERSNETHKRYSYLRYHADPVFRKNTLDYQALRRARLRGEGPRRAP